MTPPDPQQVAEIAGREEWATAVRNAMAPHGWLDEQSVQDILANIDALPVLFGPGWDEDGMCNDHGVFCCKRCARNPNLQGTHHD